MRQHEIKYKAKRLTEISLDKKGQVCPKRVRAVLESIKKEPRHRLRPLLKQYQVYLRREFKKYQAIIEYAGNLPQSTIDLVLAELREDTNQDNIMAIPKENPRLIAGLRVSLGDNVYENSVANRLSRISK